jgi:hypothetical protein
MKQSFFRTVNSPPPHVSEIPGYSRNFAHLGRGKERASGAGVTWA